MLPGVGNLADGLVELVYGSALLIKNSVGVLLMLLLIALCLAPMIKIFSIGVLLKGAAALMSLVTDKRMAQSVDRIGNAGMMLLATTGCVMLLFLIALAVVAAGKG